MDWLVVILVVTALAMIGVISLIHRGRVRIWSICMILLGLGIGILLYTQISLFKSWQTILSIVFSIVLALVLLYLFIVLGVRKQQKITKADKNPEEGDVLSTASREPMRLSDWEAVIAYSAAPAKASKEIRRVNAEKTPEVPMPASFSSAVFTPSTKVDVKPEEEAMAADAITSFFRESTQMPASAIRMDAVKRSVTANGQAEERKPYPEPLRVSPAAKPIVEPVAEKEDDEAFESLSFRVVRDKSAQGVSAVSQTKQEAAVESPIAPKSSVTKDAHVAEQETAPSPVYKVHKPATAVSVEDEAPIALETAIEQDDLTPSVLLMPTADVPEEAQQPEEAVILAKTPEQPVAEQETSKPAFVDELIAPVMEEPQEPAMQEVIVKEEPLPTVMVEEPEEYIALSPIATEWEEELVPAAQEAQPAIEEDQPLEETEPVQAEEAETVGDAGLVSEPEAVAAKVELPTLEESDPSVPEQKNAQAEFAAGMSMLNALIAAKEYRNAQTLIFDLLRMEYEPTDEEKRRLLLVMKLLKEKETKANADARSR